MSFTWTKSVDDSYYDETDAPLDRLSDRLCVDYDDQRYEFRLGLGHYNIVKQHTVSLGGSQCLGYKVIFKRLNHLQLPEMVAIIRRNKTYSILGMTERDALSTIFYNKIKPKINAKSIVFILTSNGIKVESK